MPTIFLVLPGVLPVLLRQVCSCLEIRLVASHLLHDVHVPAAVVQTALKLVRHATLRWLLPLASLPLEMPDSSLVHEQGRESMLLVGLVPVLSWFAGSLPPVGHVRLRTCYAVLGLVRHDLPILPVHERDLKSPFVLRFVAFRLRLLPSVALLAAFPLAFPLVLAAA